MANKVAMIGSGNVGAALGRTLCKSGFDVTFGVRSGKDISELLKSCEGRASEAAPAEAAAEADFVFLAVPAAAAVEAALSLGDLEGKIVVDCNNPLRWDAGPVWNPPEQGSLSEALAAALPGAHVVKAFNTFGSEFHDRPSLGEAATTTFVAGDGAPKERIIELAQTAGFVAVDAGPLRNASVLENVAMLWIHLAMVGGQGRDFVLNLVRR